MLGSTLLLYKTQWTASSSHNLSALETVVTCSVVVIKTRTTKRVPEEAVTDGEMEVGLALTMSTLPTKPDEHQKI